MDAIESLGTVIGYALWIVLSGAAGMLAGKFMNSEGSLIRDVILGIVGGGLLSFILSLVGLGVSNIIGAFLVSIVGACLLIYAAKKIF